MSDKRTVLDELREVSKAAEEWPEEVRALHERRLQAERFFARDSTSVGSEEGRAPLTQPSVHEEKK